MPPKTGAEIYAYTMANNCFAQLDEHDRDSALHKITRYFDTFTIADG